jgi:hypothetical protein
MSISEKNFLESERIRYLMVEQSPAITSASLGMTYAAPKIVDWIKTWDHHDWLGFVEITTGILGSIPSPASPALLGVSLGVSIVDAITYFQEDDPYTGGLVLAFSVLPAGQLIRILRTSKTFMKLGSKKSIDLIKKVKSGKANSSEISTAKKLVEEIAPQSEQLGKATIKQVIQNKILFLSKQSLNVILKFCMAMVKLSIFGIKAGIVIGGTFYTYDEIYKAVNYKNVEMLKSREKNKLVQLRNYITNNEDEVKESLIKNVKDVESAIEKHSSQFLTIDTSYKIEFKK